MRWTRCAHSGMGVPVGKGIVIEPQLAASRVGGSMRPDEVGGSVISPKAVWG